MLFNSFKFLIFFPVVILLYFVFPKRAKNYLLLVASYVFYMGWNPKYALLLLGCTVITYGAALLLGAPLDKEQKQSVKRAKLVVVLAIVIILSVLFYFKYLTVCVFYVSKVLKITEPKLDIILPVGISFFSFQAIGYLIDVYRGDVPVEKNFFKYALFVSFFPQLVAGPIERSKNLMTQLNESYTFDFERVKDGLFTMLWGYVLKMVIADRAAIFVDKIYGNLNQYSGAMILAATFLFAIQIYCDFCGYSIIACGAAKVIGLNLMTNFESPYFSASVQEFWRRWHISLSTWFRDYLYIPLGGSHFGKWRKRLNVLIVMLISGIWHGAGFTFIIWGLLHGLCQVFDDVVKPWREKVPKILQILVTFIIVGFIWIFFRAQTLGDAFFVFKQIFTNFLVTSANFVNSEQWSLIGFCGLDFGNLILLGLSIILLFISDYFYYKGHSVKQFILSNKWFVQVGAFVIGFVFVVVYGIWGNAYDATSFIYFQF